MYFWAIRRLDIVDALALPQVTTPYFMMLSTKFYQSRLIDKKVRQVDPKTPDGRQSF